MVVDEPSRSSPELCSDEEMTSLILAYNPQPLCDSDADSDTDIEYYYTPSPSPHSQDPSKDKTDDYI
jgi:hypothetical protein